MSNNQNENLDIIPTPTESTGTGPAVSGSGESSEKAGYFNPEKEIDKLYKWMYAVVIAITIAFFFVLADFIIEKAVIINYGNLSDKYFERYLELNNSFNEIKNQDNLKDQRILILEESNQELQETINCFKIKKYISSECFK
ncbi:MAG: hypothetical protein ABIG88_00845 [Patescibacteria group bacterium]